MSSGIAPVRPTSGAFKAVILLLVTTTSGQLRIVKVVQSLKLEFAPSSDSYMVIKEVESRYKLETLKTTGSVVNSINGITLLFTLATYVPSALKLAMVTSKLPVVCVMATPFFVQL